MRFPILLVAMTLMAASLLRAQTERSLVREGNRSYTDAKYADAEVSYRKALEANRELTEGIFNLGDALYKQERYEEAARQYEGAAARIGDRDRKARAFHNLGNALLKGQKLSESIGAYKEALKLNPSDADTKYNLEYAKALLKQQEQQQQQQQNKDQKDEENKDQRDRSAQKENEQDQHERQKNSDGKRDDQQQQRQQNKQAEEQKHQISKQDAERILEALKNEEKNVHKKIQKKVPARVRVEKDW